MKNTTTCPVFDADTHYYEPYDAFTRHIDPKYREATINVQSSDDGRNRVFVGREPLTSLTVHPQDYVGMPGTLRKLFEGEAQQGFRHEAHGRGDSDPAFVDRDARLAFMDAEGIDRALLFPSLGVMVEHQLRVDPALAHASIKAFNRWLDEDWGYDYKGRLYAVPLMSLLDPILAVDELERVIALGARMVHIRSGPLDGRSPAARELDRFWSIINDAGMPVALHSTWPSHHELVAAHWGEDPNRSISELSPLQWYLGMGERPIADMLAALVLHNLFGRFPNVQIVSIENGSLWLPHLLQELDHTVLLGRNGHWYGGRLDDTPSDILKNHLYISPFPEEDPVHLAESIPAARILFGSDYPHAEGLAHPAEFRNKLGPLGDAADDVMGRNISKLIGVL